jgi:PEP-CTERM motif
MLAKHAMFAAAAAVAVSSALCGGVAFAAICPDVSTGSTAPCGANDPAIDVVIDNFPETAIYNQVDNSVTLQEIHGSIGESRINIVTSAPTTTIYNLVENTINVEIAGPAGTSISGSINGSPTTTIYNAVDNSVSFLDLTGAPDPATFTRIESSPTTKVYDLVDNSVNIGADLQGGSLSSVLLTPTSQTIVIDSQPVTQLLNLVDNSVSLAETISTLSGTVATTVVTNTPTTDIFNVVDNTINVLLVDPLGIPIALNIDSMPITLIENLVDNSVNVTVVPEPSSWSLLALGFCAFGLLRRATTRPARAPRTPYYVGQDGGRT